MSVEFEDISPELRLVKVSGRLDILGTGQIETRYAGLTAIEKRCLIIDLTAVEFLASIGIRMLITNAKAQLQRGGKTVLLVGDNTAVAKTLEMTGIDSLVPMYKSLDEAKAAAGAA